MYHNAPIMDQTSTESSQSIEIVSGDRHQQLSQQVLWKLFRDWKCEKFNSQNFTEKKVFLDIKNVNSK